MLITPFLVIILILIVFCLLMLFYVFFFKQKTAYELRISDWSSDVCSSDLARLALMNVFVLRALTPVAAPHFSELYSAGHLAELRTLFRRQCLLSFAGAVPVFIVLTVFPGPVLALFGPAFAASETTLRVLSIGYLASAATGPCGTALMMIGR